MSTRKGLERFGVVAPTIVREPARDAQKIPICAECGHPVANSKGSQSIERPTLVDDDLDGVDRLITFGWSCERHAYDVVMPAHAHGPSAPGMIDGWIGLEVEFVDGHVRHVPTPEREVTDVE
ncbi:hypothetical protein [Natronosalvus caseinilyticus]|uniref:hypothetical protein n=1 Tax=Natronosalvus caseinilyticus TaxID=2953747 RepID=UPI0028B073F1|nr:hypothetical protein [Natronosalvus caseinilyticus]